MAMRASKLWHSPRSSRRRGSFGVGTAVEVRSNDDGFEGAWFEATTRTGVIKNRRYAVTYTDFSADGDPSSPLKEIVHCSLVRPRPPPEDFDAAFELEQCVEAFRNGGWWRGVVIKLPEGLDGLYTVYIPMTREQLRFKREEMRRQMVFVKGEWRPVEEAVQEGRDATFVQGTRVEVSRDEENFGAAWFVGNILKVIGKTNFLVEYEKLKVDSDNSTENPLKEIVDIQYLRPCPHIAVHTHFNVLDEVEGFQQDGWFTGVVLEILPESRYIVKYKHQDKEVVLDDTLLRPCHIWRNNHWVHTSPGQHSKKQTHTKTTSAIRQQKFTAGKSFDHPISTLTSGEDDADATDRSSLSGSKRKEAESTSQGLITSSQANQKSKSVRFSIHAPAFRNTDDGIIYGADAADLNDNDSTVPNLEDYSELFQACKEAGKGDLLEENVNLVGDTISVSGEKRPDADEESTLPLSSSSNNDGEGSDVSGFLNLKDKKFRDPSFKDNSFEPSKNQNKRNSLEENVQPIDDTLMNSGWKTPAKVGKCSTASRLTVEKDTTFVTHESTVSDGKVASNYHPIPLSREFFHEKGSSCMGGTDGPIIMRKESTGCLRVGTEHQPVEANLVCSPPTGPEVSDFVPAANMGNDICDPCRRENTKTHTKTIVRTPELQRKIPDDVDFSQHKEELMEHNGSLSTNNKIISMIGNDTVSLPNKEANMMEASPLTPRIESSKRSSGKDIVMDCGTPLIDSSHMESSSVRSVLPFIKTSSEVWNLVESREVFRMLPQRPHFQPLLHHAKLHREGIAIGLMITFANLVTDIGKLLIVDSTDDFEEKLKVLDEMELNGFNVQPVRSRLEKLIEIRSMLSQAEGKKRSLKAKELEVHDEKEKMYQLLYSVDEKLKQLKEKRESTILEIKKSETEIGELEKGVKAAEEVSKSAEQQFVATLTAPWR
ncbi:uncharacterized protein A4U43_C04F8000 [Asparagus officinalis]|uniref:Agenet domain-containing protein n=1 Tax=Asparagus officinalis TaxID=4686 RepID=A0A5P1EZ62_ASPOF|nr:DUF724 domain-containing protein 3-like isoform X1 [Asparagus officinalis]ONK71385.1 uncharacterized protein A4U43_C04F8000 [Asparagus officinalis]